MQMPDKEMRTRDYGEWLCEVGNALIAELRGAQLSYRDAIHALEAAARALEREALSQGMEALAPGRERHG